MRTTSILAAVLTIAALAASSTSRAEEEKPKHTIKEVMIKAHKDGLLKKIVAGMGTKADAEQLLELYESLGRSKPPKGEPGSWKEKTGELVKAAQDVVEGKEGSRKRLEAAANCANCHKVHKG